MTKIKKSNQSVCIIGLGYVGLTLGVALARSGIKVHGVEINNDVINSLDNFQAHFSEKGLNQILQNTIKSNALTYSKEIPKSKKFSYYIITVGTPLNEEGLPRTDMIERSAAQISKHMDDNSVVILRSTVVLGTTRETIEPILKRSKKKYMLAMCPERTLEGRALEELSNLPQIIGADNVQTAQKCSELFQNITPKTTIVSSWETAELIKLVDNTSRDLSFAFSNEIAKISSLFGVDVYEVINKGKADYSRTNLPLPGPVGGPCLEKDPHILSYSSKKKNFHPPITNASRQINEDQVRDIAVILKNRLNNELSQSKVLFCGLAFKGIPETDDLRGSMGIKLIDEFQNCKNIYVYDPVVKKITAEKYGKFFDFQQEQSFDLILLLNNHPKFNEIGYENLSKNLSKDGFIFDFWRTLDIFDQTKNYYHLGNINKL